MSFVEFYCADCRQVARAVFPDGCDDDVIHCTCGLVYLVTKPYIVEIRRMYKAHVEEDD